MIADWEARCMMCDAEYHSPAKDPTPHKQRSQILNRRIWAEGHYANTGHHRFVTVDTKEHEISVAAIPPRDPNQLSLADDENFSTFTLGENP